jgi:hypothetical protein
MSTYARRIRETFKTLDLDYEEKSRRRRAATRTLAEQMASALEGSWSASYNPLGYGGEDEFFLVNQEENEQLLVHLRQHPSRPLTVKVYGITNLSPARDSYRHVGCGSLSITAYRTPTTIVRAIETDFLPLMRQAL